MTEKTMPPRLSYDNVHARTVERNERERQREQGRRPQYLPPVSPVSPVSPEAAACITARSLTDAVCPKCKAPGYMGWHVNDRTCECGRCRAVVSEAEIAKSEGKGTT